MAELAPRSCWGWGRCELADERSNTGAACTCVRAGQGHWATACSWCDLSAAAALLWSHSGPIPPSPPPHHPTHSHTYAQIGYHDTRKVRKTKVDRKSNDIINRLEKTREERNPDFAAEKEVGACV